LGPRNVDSCIIIMSSHSPLMPGCRPPQKGDRALFYSAGPSPTARLRMAGAGTGTVGDQETGLAFRGTEIPCSSATSITRRPPLSRRAPTGAPMEAATRGS